MAHAEDIGPDSARYWLCVLSQNCSFLWSTGSTFVNWKIWTRDFQDSLVSVKAFNKKLPFLYFFLSHEWALFCIPLFYSVISGAELINMGHAWNSPGKICFHELFGKHNTLFWACWVQLSSLILPIIYTVKENKWYNTESEMDMSISFCHVNFEGRG